MFEESQNIVLTPAQASSLKSIENGNYYIDNTNACVWDNDSYGDCTLTKSSVVLELEQKIADLERKMKIIERAMPWLLETLESEEQ